MANICDQRITVVADTDADIVPVLEKFTDPQASLGDCGKEIKC